MSDRALHTPRLELRPTLPQDVGPLHALWIQPGVRRWLFDDLQISLDAARDLVAQSRRAWESRGYGLYVLSDASSPLLGFCGLREPESNGAAELVYGIADERAGHGLATEAALAVLDHAFGSLGLPRVAASVDEPNLASRGVLAKLGMRCTGRRLVEGRPTLFHELARAAFPGQSSGMQRANGPD